MTGRWTYRVSAAGVLVLAAAAFTLSYDALHQLALDSRVRPGLAWMWPVVIDGTIPPAEHEARPDPAPPHTPGDHPAPEPASADRGAKVGARAWVLAAYQAQVAAGQAPTGSARRCGSCVA
jgi:hypothetical protein